MGFRPCLGSKPKVIVVPPDLEALAEQSSLRNIEDKVSQAVRGEMVLRQAKAAPLDERKQLGHLHGYSSRAGAVHHLRREQSVVYVLVAGGHIRERHEFHLLVSQRGVSERAVSLVRPIRASHGTPGHAA